jgi:hypothetical protein
MGKKMTQALYAHMNNKKIKNNNCNGQAPVAQAYNPSYSGGRDQEDHSSKPAQANSS